MPSFMTDLTGVTGTEETTDTHRRAGRGRTVCSDGDKSVVWKLTQHYVLNTAE